MTIFSTEKFYWSNILMQIIYQQLLIKHFELKRISNEKKKFINNNFMTLSIKIREEFHVKVLN